MYTKQTLSAAASGVTNWVDARKALGASITVVIPAGPVGTLVIEGSDDQAQIRTEIENPTTPAAASTAAYRDVTSAATVVGSINPANSAVTVVVQPSFPCSYLRFRYTRTSGTGTLTFHYSIR